MCSFRNLWLIIIITTIPSNESNNEYTNDLIGPAINGYAAILDRVGKIYKMASYADPSNTRNEFIERNRRKIERELLKHGNNKNEKEIINELLNKYDASPINDDYSIPIIDEIFGFNKKHKEEEPKQAPPKNNAQYEYIRRRLEEETYSDIICNNSKNLTHKYDTDYKFMFNPFTNCNLSNTINSTTTIHTIATGANAPILYSSNCEFMLLLNAISGQLQIIASQQSQTIPMWTSDNLNNNNNTNAIFNASNGDFIVFDHNNNIIWSASNTSHWNANNKNINNNSLQPYVLILDDNLGELHIVDSNNDIKWYSNGVNIKQNVINYRQREYRVNLTDNANNILLSLSMNVQIMVHREQHFHLQFEYEIPAVSADNNDMSEYIAIMLAQEYKFNLSVYQLSTHNIGDKYIIYDDNLPMIYALMNNKLSARLSISESHTFLCMDNNTRYFNIDMVPFAQNISIHSNNNNYTLSLHPSSTGNYTFFINPWNPCHDGQPVLAQNAKRQCFIKYELSAALSDFNKYLSNNAYSDINMKYIFKSPQCVLDILSNKTQLNQTVLFPKDFNLKSCENYMINGTVNTYFNSTFCNVIRGQCSSGYYDICLSYTSSLCTCYCPRDKKGVNCAEYRDYNCKLNILSANMTQCELMTQAELNAHGRSDYDVELDGDKPCFFITEDGVIASVVQLHCYFSDVVSDSKVWEELTAYEIYSENITFDYCLGNESSSFALSSSPPKSTLRLKIFNFARIFNDDETYVITLDINHWSGDKYIYHNKWMEELHEDYKIGGRIYIEYQLWQMDEHNKQQHRINVERRFYDIDHWVMPESLNSKFDNSQRWFIAIVTVTMLVLVIFCVWQCNKWCKKLEHEKND